MRFHAPNTRNGELTWTVREAPSVEQLYIAMKALFAKGSDFPEVSSPEQRAQVFKEILETDSPEAAREIDARYFPKGAGIVQPWENDTVRLTIIAHLLSYKYNHPRSRVPMPTVTHMPSWPANPEQSTEFLAYAATLQGALKATLGRLLAQDSSGWGDSFWGNNGNSDGASHLGNLLMKIRGDEFGVTNRALFLSSQTTWNELDPNLRSWALTRFDIIHVPAGERVNNPSLIHGHYPLAQVVDSNPHSDLRVAIDVAGETVVSNFGGIKTEELRRVANDFILDQERALDPQ